MRQLAEQVGIAIWGDAVYMYNPDDTLDYDVLSKFTELIVKECAEVAHCNFHVDGLTLGGIMKKHFGVEE
jgi:hypothetical protein